MATLFPVVCPDGGLSGDCVLGVGSACCSSNASSGIPAATSDGNDDDGGIDGS